MNKIDYNKKMLEICSETNRGRKLLLHSCCGPCSSRCIETLKEYFDVTVLFYNPNITDPQEYEKRKSEQLRLLHETQWADFLDCDYNPNEFFTAVRGLEGEKEGGARCPVCYRLRMEYTARTAKERGFDYFCTTLSVSPHKNAQWINAIGEALQRECGISWLYSDFKKQNGYLRSIELSNEYKLYRQNYCGCVFSDWTKQQSDSGTSVNK